MVGHRSEIDGISDGGNLTLCPEEYRRGSDDAAHHPDRVPKAIPMNHGSLTVFVHERRFELLSPKITIASHFHQADCN